MLNKLNLFLTGLLIGLIISIVPPVRAIGATLDEVTIKDLVAACCLGGMVGKHGLSLSNVKECVKQAYAIADEAILYKQTNKKK